MAEHHAPAAPLYLRVAAALRDDLARQRIAPGARLPSERCLAHRFQVNRETVRSALRLLREERLVVTERRGTFAATTAAADREPALAPGLLHFPYGPDVRGGNAEAHLALEPVPPALAGPLGLPPGEPSLVHRHRVLGPGGTVVRQAHSRFSRYAEAEVPELARHRRPDTRPQRSDLRPLYHWMHRAGLRLTRRESIGVDGGAGDGGDGGGGAPGATAYLTVHRVVRDQHGHVLEVTDIRFAPESAPWTYEFTG